MLESLFSQEMGLTYGSEVKGQSVPGSILNSDCREISLFSKQLYPIHGISCIIRMLVRMVPDIPFFIMKPGLGFL